MVIVPALQRLVKGGQFPVAPPPQRLLARRRGFIKALSESQACLAVVQNRLSADSYGHPFLCTSRHQVMDSKEVQRRFRAAGWPSLLTMACA